VPSLPSTLANWSSSSPIARNFANSEATLLGWSEPNITRSAPIARTIAAT
jgi:hypothetical protein